MKSGQTIGHYKILRPPGKDGIGEVYLAEATKAKREVAIKVLPERVRNDQDRLRRFRREAEAAACSVPASPALFSAGQVQAINPANKNFDVRADGRLFMVVQQVYERETPTITVVHNWIGEFADRE